MENYEINEDTYAVISDKGKTRIIEKNCDYTLNNKAYSVMDESCKYYGSSYLGRLQAGKTILNCSYKVPILVEESRVIVFFPIKSSLEKDCSWINSNGIKSIDQIGNRSIITFKNGRKKIFNISKLSLENQIYKAAKLESTIFRRKNIKNRD